MIIAPKKAPLRIHINSHIIRGNRKNKTNYPPITIRYGNGKIAHRATESKAVVRSISFTAPKNQCHAGRNYGRKPAIL